MNEAMKVGALAPWFGAKRIMAPLIVTELGKHTQYFEPFCGSMAVLFAKEPTQKETVNDLHGDLINLARCLQDPEVAEMLYDRCARTLVCEAILDDARARLGELPFPTNGICFERAYWYFVASWQGRNGTAGTKRVDYQIAVRWTKGGGSPTVRWRHAWESIPAWHKRLANVVILRRDAFKIVDRFEDTAATAIYCDPPYYMSSRTGYRAGRGSSNKYLHEFDHDNPMFGNDHERLREMLGAYKRARVVVSYYDCPEIRKLYEGWTFIEHTRQKHLHAQGGRGARAKEAPEVLILNGSSYV